MKNLILAAGACAVLLSAGCAGTQRTVGGQRIVERSSSSQPNWQNVPFSESREKMNFSGTVKNVADYSVGLRQAKAEALKNVAESIQTRVRTEFVENTRGSNLSTEDLGKFVQDGVAMVADNIEISGLLPVESYYEKVETTTWGGVEYSYNCSVLVELAVSDYKIARKRAIEGLADEARRANNKAAEETAQELLEKLY